MQNYILYDHQDKPMQVFLARPKENNYLSIAFFKKGKGSSKGFNSTSWEIRTYQDTRPISSFENTSSVNKYEQRLINLLNEIDKKSRRNRIEHIGGGKLYHASDEVLKLAWEIYQKFHPKSEKI